MLSLNVRIKFLNVKYFLYIVSINADTINKIFISPKVNELVSEVCWLRDFYF